MIDRHNYEEVFLLYVDHELNDAERIAVEKFVEQNPDLKAELEMLQQATLSADSISFGDKDLLLKKEEGISISNYEEYFLLSVDNALNKQQKDDVEKFVLTHPKLQDEYTLLQKTKLEPEAIVFKRKEDLYRRKRRVIPMLWRMSAAAALIGVVAFSLLMLDNNTSEVTPVLANNSKPIIEIVKDKTQPLTNTGVTHTTAASLDNQQARHRATEENIVATKEDKRQERNITTVKQPKQEQKIKEEVMQNNEPVQENQLAATSPNRKNEQQDTEPVNLVTRIETDNMQKSLATHQPAAAQQQSIVHQALYTELPETNEEEKTLYIGSLQINKNKLKSIFKKATGIFGKKKDENNEKSLKVASFEIRTT